MSITAKAFQSIRERVRCLDRRCNVQPFVKPDRQWQVRAHMQSLSALAGSPISGRQISHIGMSAIFDDTERPL